MIKTIDDWDNKYTLDASVHSKEFDDGRLETYGEDLDEVLRIAKETPKKVWTAIDGDDGFYLISGYHLVNRVYYEISIEDCEEESEEYLIDSYEGDTNEQ